MLVRSGFSRSALFLFSTYPVQHLSCSALGVSLSARRSPDPHSPGQFPTDRVGFRAVGAKTPTRRKGWRRTLPRTGQQRRSLADAFSLFSSRPPEPNQPIPPGAAACWSYCHRLGVGGGGFGSGRGPRRSAHLGRARNACPHLV